MLLLVYAFKILVNLLANDINNIYNWLHVWSNRVARHLVLLHSFVVRGFLTCSEEQE